MSTRPPQASGSFSITAVLAMIVVGVVAFSAFLVLLAFADDLRDPNDAREHAMSRSAVGFAGIVALLADTGETVRVSRGTLEEAARDGSFVVLTPPAGLELTWEVVTPIYGSNLVVLPKWETRPQANKRLWVDKIGLYPSELVEAAIRQLTEDIKVGRMAGTTQLDFLDVETDERLPIGPVDHLQTISGENLEPIITDADGNIVLATMLDEEDEPVAYVLSDPDLLDTHGLKSPLTARVALRIFDTLRYDDSPITFDLTLHGLSRSRNMLQLALTPPFLPAVLCFVFAAVLIATVALAGNPRTTSGRDIPFGKMTLVDNTAKLVSQSGRSAAVAQRYVVMIRRQAIRSLGLSATATEAQQAAMLDALHRNGGNAGASRYSELASNVAKATRTAAMLQAMKRIYTWKQELGLERSRR